MAVTHKLVLARFQQGWGFTQLCARHNLAEWELEEILRIALVDAAQRELALTVEVQAVDTPSPEPVGHPFKAGAAPDACVCGRPITHRFHQPDLFASC